MTTTLPTPDVRPANPRFSSGPCAKRPDWAPENLDLSTLGRSHRSKPGKATLKRINNYKHGRPPAACKRPAASSDEGWLPVGTLARNLFGLVERLYSEHLRPRKRD